MENLGALSILLAFCLAVFAAVAAVAGKYAKRPFLVLSAERAVYAIWALLTLASSLLIYALMTGDFRLAYVAAHSDRAMSPIYKFTAWWGGQEGSLLLWSWLLATYSAVIVFTNRRKFREHDAAGDRRDDGDPRFLRQPDHVCRQPVPGLDGWAKGSSMRAMATA